MSLGRLLFYAQHITLPRSTVNILIDRLRDNFTFPYLGTTPGSSRREGEPSGELTAAPDAMAGN